MEAPFIFIAIVSRPEWVKLRATVAKKKMTMKKLCVAGFSICALYMSFLEVVYIKWDEQLDRWIDVLLLLL